MTDAAQVVEYTPGAEIPDITFTWKDANGLVIDFVAQPHTFSFRVGAVPPFSKGVLAGSQTGITSAASAPNVTVSLASGDLDALAPGDHAGQLWARRTADGKDRQPVRFVFRVLPAI